MGLQWSITQNLIDVCYSKDTLSSVDRVSLVTVMIIFILKRLWDDKIIIVQLRNFFNDLFHDFSNSIF